jgi:hypothetical protein
LGVIIGVATTSATLAVTLSVKAVVLVTAPPVDVTVIGKLPAGVDPLVFTVNTVEQVGPQEAVEKDPVAPEGSPETEKATDWLVPEVKVGVIVFEPDEPAFTEIAPEFESEKSNGCGWFTVKDALAWALGLYPLLNAAALTTALFVRVMAPV